MVPGDEEKYLGEFKLNLKLLATISSEWKLQESPLHWRKYLSFLFFI